MNANFNSSNISRYSIWWRRIIHRPLVAIFRLSLGRKVRLFRNDFVSNGKPTIFVATHVFYDDAAVALCCLKSAAYLLFGVESDDNLPSFKERFVARLNGVIGVERNNKQSRIEAFYEMVEVLNRRGDILVFPEAAWNFLPNTVVAKINWGAIRVAQHTGANIVPIAVNIVGNDYGVIIGNHFEYSNYTNSQEAVDSLRDKMATLAWELISLSPLAHRENLTYEYWLSHIREQFANMPRKDQSKEESFMYRPKDEVSLGEVLADLHGIEYKSMAADYEQHKRIERLIDGWTKPVRF